MDNNYSLHHVVLVSTVNVLCFNAVCSWFHGNIQFQLLQENMPQGLFCRGWQTTKPPSLTGSVIQWGLDVLCEFIHGIINWWCKSSGLQIFPQRILRLKRQGFGVFLETSLD